MNDITCNFILAAISLSVVLLKGISSTTQPLDEHAYLYGRGIFTAHRHVILQSPTSPLPREIHSIVAYFGPRLTNRIMLQLWSRAEGMNYTLDWQVIVEPTGKTGRTLIELQSTQYFSPSSSAYKIGLYCETDPCPILYDFLPGVDTVISADSFVYNNTDPETVSTLFEELLLPLLFAVALCETTECDALPTPTLPPVTSSEMPTPKYQEQTVILTDKPSALLKENVILGILIWLIIISFLFISMIFLLVCLFLRPKQKDPRKETETGDWLVVLEKNESNKSRGAERLNSRESTSKESI